MRLNYTSSSFLLSQLHSFYCESVTDVYLTPLSHTGSMIVVMQNRWTLDKEAAKHVFYYISGFCWAIVTTRICSSCFRYWIRIRSRDKWCAPCLRHVIEYSLETRWHFQGMHWYLRYAWVYKVVPKCYLTMSTLDGSRLGSSRVHSYYSKCNLPLF